MIRSADAFHDVTMRFFLLRDDAVFGAFDDGREPLMVFLSLRGWALMSASRASGSAGRVREPFRVD